MLVKNAKELIDVVSQTLKAEWFEEKQYDFEKALEMKALMNPLEIKANEAVHTGNTGYGAELVPWAVQTTDFIDLMPRLSPFIGALKGYHGRNMDKIMEVPVIGELPYHDLMPESTTSLISFSNAKAKQPTAKITISQKKYFLDIDVTDEEVRFVNVIDVIGTIQRKLAFSGQKTIEWLVVNGDTITAATWNVNSDDWAPTATNYYLGWNGLRKAWLANPNGTVDIWTMVFDDFLAMLIKLSDNGVNPQDLIFVFNGQTYTTALWIDEFKDYAKNGKSTTINTGALTNVLWSDVFTSVTFGKTEADGKQSVTPANNTKGWVILAHNLAVQYGFNWEYQLEIVRNPWIGWKIVWFFYVWINTTNNATVTDAALEERLKTMVALWINATI